MKTLFNFIIILFFALPLLLSAQIVEEGLIAYYPLDGNANNYSEYNLDGEVFGAKSTTDRFGNLNSAYYFDGIDDYISLSNSPKLKPEPPFSVAFWACYYDSTIHTSPFFCNDLNDERYYGVYFQMNDSRRIGMQIGNGGSISPASRKTEYAADQTPPVNEWFHVVGIVDNSLNLTIYINGDKINTISSGTGTSLAYSNGIAALGIYDKNPYFNGPPYYLNGKIDEVYMFDRVLSDHEIEELAFDNSSDHSAKYSLSIDSLPVILTDNAVIPLTLKVPEGKSFSAFQFNITGFTGNAEFISLVENESTLLGDDWLYSANSINDTLIIAGSSGSTCDSSGTLLKFKMKLNEPNLPKTIPLNISGVLFDDGKTKASTNNGSIIIMNPKALTYGDVDYNDIIRRYDASLILKYLVGKMEFTQPQKMAADVSLDSTISAYDASLILEYIKGNIPPLPYINEEDPASQDLLFYMPDITTSKKNEIEIPVYLKSSATIASLEGEFNYDEDLLEFYTIKTGGALSEFEDIDFNYDKGKLKFAAFGPKVDVQDSLLLNLTFYNMTGEDISADIILSKIKINEEEVLENVASTHLITAVEDNSKIPTDYYLLQNYPNPFNPTTNIQYSIPQNGFVTIKIFNALGQEVAVLVNEMKTAGKYTVSFNASNLASGIYFYRISSGDYIKTKKMMLVK